MRHTYIILTSIIFSVAYLLFPAVSFAEDEYVGFSVKALLPENQVEGNFSYFNLRVQPNDVQTLKTNVYNSESEPITVALSVRNGTTNRNGLIVYEETEADPNADFLSLTEIVSFTEEEIMIPPGESRIVSATLEVPEEPFDGVVLGGLHFEKVTDDNHSDTSDVMIQNRYAYVIGVVLSETDKEAPVEFNLIDVKADLINYRTANVITIENDSPNIVEDLVIDAKIFKDNDTKPLREKYQDNIKMAPHSMIEFVVDWENKKLESGNYRVEVQVTYLDESWNWEESFVIEAEEAEQINREAIELEEEPLFKLNGFVLSSTVVLVGIIFGLLLYIRKLKKAVES